jgi:hydrogenase maturation protease
MGGKLLGVISGADQLIVVDAIRNRGTPGSLYRLEGEEIPSRMRAKNSLHEMDFLETLTCCRVLDGVPPTVLLGAEPEDMETLGVELTPTLLSKVDPVAEMVLGEIRRVGASYAPRNG